MITILTRIFILMALIASTIAANPIPTRDPYSWLKISDAHTSNFVTRDSITGFGPGSTAYFDAVYFNTPADKVFDIEYSSAVGTYGTMEIKAKGQHIATMYFPMTANPHLSRMVRCTLDVVPASICTLSISGTGLAAGSVINLSRIKFYSKLTLNIDSRDLRLENPFVANSTYTFNWYSSKDIYSVNLEYDNGSGWQPIARHFLNSNSINWHIPEMAAGACTLRVSADSIVSGQAPPLPSSFGFSVIKGRSAFSTITARTCNDENNMWFNTADTVCLRFNAVNPYLRYRALDFGTGCTGIAFRIMGVIVAGPILFYLDNVPGVLIGNYALSDQYGDTTLVKPLAITPTGVHDLVVCPQYSQPVAQFDFCSFRFLTDPLVGTKPMMKHAVSKPMLSCRAITGGYAFSCSIPERAPVSLSLYTLSGKLVRVLDRQVRNAGTYAIRWNGDGYTGANLIAELTIDGLKSGTMIVPAR